MVLRYLLLIIFSLLTGCLGFQGTSPTGYGTGNVQEIVGQQPTKNGTGKVGNIFLDPRNALSSYRLDSGDLVSIKVFGEPDFDVEVRLSDAGTISYPFLGELKITGHTVGEVEQLITSGLVKGYLVDPKVTVKVAEYRHFFVNGEIKKPGDYPYQPGLTVNKAISIAGGFTDIANRGNILIIREGSNREEQVSLDTLVRPGDILVIKESFF